MIERDTWYQLGAITGADEDDVHAWLQPDRVVGFMLTEAGTLRVEENCDEFYRADLTGEQVDRLIAWLTAARAAMP